VGVSLIIPWKLNFKFYQRTQCHVDYMGHSLLCSTFRRQTGKVAFVQTFKVMGLQLPENDISNQATMNIYDQLQCKTHQNLLTNYTTSPTSTNS